MKNLIKIVICTILALTIIIVPMTVSAESTYQTSKTKLNEGSNVYTISANYDYTVFILNPTATGDFTITTNDGLIGIVSYLDMWVQFEPTEEIVNLNTIEWSCTDKNQSIMVAVKSDLAEVNITVSRKDLDTSNEVEWTIYENKKAPEKFVMPSFVDVNAFDDGYVDFEDSIIDDAVLGDDGYYHLNEKDGPVLFANLDDSIMSLYAMSGYGKVAAIYYDDAGEVIKKVDYTDAFNQYISALPTNSSGVVTSYYYPLNADLIEMYKEIGASHGWYSGTEAWVYASDDAWLYACYFDENVTSMNASENEDKEDVKDEDNTNNENNNSDNNQNSNTNNNVNNTTGSTNTNTNINTDASNKSPTTKDSYTAVFAVATLSAAAIVWTSKKK